MKCKKCGFIIISSPDGKCPQCGWKESFPSKGFYKALIIGVLIIFGMGYFASRNVSYDPEVLRSETRRTIAKNNESSKKWFQGGTLHNATIAQWKSATYQNKLATASDWLTATEWKGHLNSLDDFDKLNIKSQMLVRAVDKVVSGEEMKQLDFMKANEIAASIVTMSNDLGP